MKSKYRRLVWDKVCTCILTRNDILSSTNTIHPSDNRVFSIRELMRVMTIPETFRWTDKDDLLTVENAPEYLRENELNIRRCIGEAVPTHIMENVAMKIKIALSSTSDKQEDFFNQVKDLKVRQSFVKIRANDVESIVDFLPQICGLLSDKDGIEICCSETQVDEIIKTINLWDLNDFVTLRQISAYDDMNYQYNLSLANGKLTVL